MLTDLGDSHAATALIDDARNVLALHPSGAGPQQARLGVLERQIEAGHPATAIADQLTNRELSVLRLLCGALSLRAIGTELSQSPNTIKTHVRAIYRKLGVNTRGDAVQAARAIHIV